MATELESLCLQYHVKRILEYKGRVRKFNDEMDAWYVTLRRVGVTETISFMFYSRVWRTGGKPNAGKISAGDVLDAMLRRKFFPCSSTIQDSYSWKESEPFRSRFNAFRRMLRDDEKLIEEFMQAEH